MEIVENPGTSAFQQAEQKRAQVKNIAFKYLSYWPFFLFSVVAALVVGNLYIRYTTPLYYATVRMLIADKSQVDKADEITKAVFGARPINMDNELQSMRSIQLMKRVVLNHHLNIYYTASGRINQREFFDNEPISFLPIVIGDSSKTYTYKIVLPDNNGGLFELEDGTRIPFKFGETIFRDGNQFVLRRNVPVKNMGEKGFLTIQWVPITNAANDILGALNIQPFSEKTTIISATMSTKTPARAIASLNGFVDEFINFDVEKKNENSVKILQFINQRIRIVEAELDSMQANMLAFRKKSRFLSVEAEASYYSAKVLNKETTIDESQFNLLLADYLESYIKSGNYPSPHKIIPVPLLPDPAVLNSINFFNTLQLQKDKGDSIYAAKGLIYKDISNDLKNALNDIFISINNFRKLQRFKIKDDEFKRDSNLVQQKQMPEKLQEYEDMQRRILQKQQTYAYLLQRKEQQELYSVSSKSNYEKMDSAASSYQPYEPEAGKIRTLSIVFGLAIPIIVIFLIDFLTDKIKTREDIVKRTTVPIVGEISHSDAVDAVLIKESRNIIGEQFRILRTNLQYLGVNTATGPRAKTILITSSISGEGKSFVSLNLASVLAVTGKKVALLEFDLRKIQSLKIAGNEITKKGISNYLIGQINDPAELIIKIADYPSLHLFNSGSLPPNPAELILSERTSMLMAWLKDNYDYIIMDSAPIGPVSDSFTLAKYADVVLYVIRQMYTFKRNVDMLNDIANSSGKLQNLALVINDVKISGRYGYYGYGNTYGYGYGYGYGYSYHDKEKKKNGLSKLFNKK